MAGYVAADMGGTVLSTEVAPSARWKKIKYSGSSFPSTPDITDSLVYIDECVNLMKEKLGTALDSGINAYYLDNEPDLWNSTHSRLHPAKATVNEVFKGSLELAASVKSIDANAQIIGPALSGWNGFVSLNSAPDWSSYQSNFKWFTEAYLDFFKQKSDSAGKRLLDVLDVHWYPEASYGSVRVIWSNQTNSNNNDTMNQGLIDARLQCPRSLWDTTYNETSWINSSNKGPIALLKKLNKQIDTYYPGTKLAITEFEYGASKHYSGGIAIADVLGIFGKENVYMSNIWSTTTDYIESAYKLYGNYDNNFSRFGNISIDATTDDVQNISTFASIDSSDTTKIHVIVLNKSGNLLTPTFTLNGIKNIYFKEVYGFGEYNKAVTLYSKENVSYTNSFSHNILPHTAYHFVLYTSPDNIPVIQNTSTASLSKTSFLANETSTLTLSNSANQQVSIIIVNRNKAITSTLVNAMLAQGTTTYTIDAKNYTNGSYIIKVTAGDKTMFIPFEVKMNTISLDRTSIGIGGYTRVTTNIVADGIVSITYSPAGGSPVRTVYNGFLATGTYIYKIYADDSSSRGTYTVLLHSQINDYSVTFENTKPLNVNTHSNSTENNFVCVPNPASNNTEIHYFATAEDNVEINIINQQGVSVVNIQHLLTPGNGSISINTDQLAEGIYIVKLSGKSFNKCEKLIIKK